MKAARFLVTVIQFGGRLCLPSDAHHENGLRSAADMQSFIDEYALDQRHLVVPAGDAGVA